MALSSFFSEAKSYGKWDATSQESLTPEDKQQISHIEVIEGTYGKTACFYLRGTNRVKMFQMDDSCQPALGARLDVDSVVFQHYTDGSQVSTRVIANVQQLEN